MKLTPATLAFALVQLTLAQYTNQSAPFYLYIVSDNSTVNNSTLSACHAGAAIESLCLSIGKAVSISQPLPSSQFTFNTSASPYIANASLGPTGYLSYSLPTQPPIPSLLEFYSDPTSNYALPLLVPGSYGGQIVSFDSNNLMNIQGYIDYTVSPPKAGPTLGYYRWYSCQTYYEGYEYVNLVWVYGSGEPETPGCAKVDVKRVFI